MPLKTTSKTTSLLSVRTRTRARGEDGIGAIGSSIGALMLLGLLLLALHTMLALQTRSLVGAAAWEAARSLAVHDGSSAAEATARVQDMISGLDPTVRIVTSGDTVSVTVTAKSPGFFPGVTTFDRVRSVTRTATMRRERVQ